MNPIARALRAVSRKRGSHHGGRRQRMPLHQRLTRDRVREVLDIHDQREADERRRDGREPFIGGFGGQS